MMTPAHRSTDDGASELLALLPADRSLEARVREAARSALQGAAVCPAIVIGYARVEDLRRALAAYVYALLLVGPRDLAGTPTYELIRGIRESYPRLPMVGVVRSRTGVSADVFALAKAGVHQLVMQGIDDSGVALQAILSSALRQSVADAVACALQSHVPPNVLPFIRYCLTNLELAPSVPEIASALGVHRKTLVNWMRAAHLPPPRNMATWCRLLVAASLLEERGRSIEQVARSLDFPSANAFRNVLRRYTGLNPSEVRGAGGLSAVVEQFGRMLRSTEAITAAHAS